MNIETLNKYYKEGWELDLIKLCDEKILKKNNTKYRLLHVLNSVDKDKKKENKFLDIACGVGTTSFLLSRIYKKSKFYCVDIAENQIDIGKKYVEINNLNDQFKFIVDDVTKDLDIYKNNYDCVICCEIIEHLKEPQILLEKVNRIGDKNTQFIFSSPTGRNINDHIRYRVSNEDGTTRVLDNPKKIKNSKVVYEFYHKNYGKGEFIKLIRDQNFKIDKVMGAQFLGNNNRLRYYIDRLTNYSSLVDKILNTITLNYFAQTLLVVCRKN